MRIQLKLKDIEFLKKCFLEYGMTKAYDLLERDMSSEEYEFLRSEIRQLTEWTLDENYYTNSVNARVEDIYEEISN